MKKTNYLLFLLLWIIVPKAFGQLEQSIRVELAKDAKDEEEFDVTPLESEGVLVTIKKTDYFSSSPFVWKFIKYDTQLREKWKAEFKVGFGKNPLLSYHNKQYQFWLFGDPDSDDISVHRLDLSTGETDEIEGQILGVEVVSHFKVLGNTAILAGKYREKPVVAMFSFFDKSTKVLPSIYTNNMEIVDLEVDDEAQQVIVFSRSLKLKTGCQLTIRRYAYDGKLLFTNVFPANEDRTLLTGKLMPIHSGEYLVIGSYAASCSSYSQGIYVTKVKGDESFPVKYIEFSEMANFFNYMKPKRQQRIQEKIARKKEEGKEAHFRYMVLVHDFVKTPDELILVAESFYPQYYSTGNITNPVTRTSRDRVNGFRYTHALICGFDKDGNLRWDNSFPLQDLETNQLGQQVQITYQQNRLVLAYPKEGKINTQLISGSKVVKEKEEFEVKTTYENEKILFAENASLSAWYEQYFLAWGFQKIETTMDKNTSQREVFYLNKLTYKSNDGRAKL